MRNIYLLILIIFVASCTTKTGISEEEIYIKIKRVKDSLESNWSQVVKATRN